MGSTFNQYKKLAMARREHAVAFLYEVLPFNFIPKNYTIK